MSVTELIKRKRFAPGKGVTELPPEQGIRRFGFILWTHLSKLVILNLLLIAFSIPVVTMPAALCGVNRVLIKLVREGNCFLWSDFWQEFKANLVKALPFGLFTAFLLFDSYYALSVSTSGGGILPGALGLFLLGMAVLFGSYAFVLLPSLDLKGKYITKNTFILMMTEWKTNLAILGCALALGALIAAIFPYSAILMLFISFSLMQLIICTAVNGPLQRRIIAPYEQRQKEGSESWQA